MNVRSQVQRAASAARGALSFAHLSGVAASKAADDENEDKEKKDAAAAADEKDDKDDKDTARAEDKDDEEHAEEEDKDKEKDASDGDDDSDKKDKAKKAKSADGDDDDEEMRGEGAAAQARRRERERCASIMGCKHAAGRAELAANLAFKTDLTREQAIGVLQGTPANSAASARSTRNPSLGAGGTMSGNPKVAIANSWDAAMKKANPARR